MVKLMDHTIENRRIQVFADGESGKVRLRILGREDLFIVHEEQLPARTAQLLGEALKGAAELVTGEEE
jgi:hypothetical protein